MTRAEHLEWSKKRAMKYVDCGDSQQAMASMMSDLMKHDELRDHPGIALGVSLLMCGHLKGNTQMRSWIEGFN